VKASKILFLVFIIVTSLQVVNTQPVRANPQTIIVPDDYLTIGWAIGNASEGDIIFVKKGTYEGPINETLIIDKTISLIGEETTTLNLHPLLLNATLFGQPYLTYDTSIIVESNNVTISGFTVKTPSIHAGAGISVIGDGIHIINCIITPSVSLKGSYSTILETFLISDLMVKGSNQTIAQSTIFNYMEITSSHNNIIGNDIGNEILLKGSYNLISGNSFNMILLEHSDSNEIYNNTCSCIWVGFYGHTCSNNIISGNILDGGYIWGILMGDGSYNVFYDNYISNYGGSHDGYGVAIGGTHSVAENNTFYHNTFVNNNKNVGYNWDLEGTGNFWDNGIEGNYWDDYNGTDANGDGIGDTPYVIDANNQDNYPLMEPVVIPTIVIPEFPVEENPKTSPTDPSPTSPTSQPSPSPTFIAMPEEYINYTISRVNGSLWAEVDGTYPLYVSYEKSGFDDVSKLNDTSLLVASDELPMVYPTPPGTTNISVKMNETELNWSNYTETRPEATHHTAIGDWPMIYCTIHPVPDHFILKIHYEHPIVLINGSYTFLYDLNISPYLSSWCNKSTAYFNIRMETKYEDFHVYTTGSEAWNPVNYTLTKENTAGIVSIKIISEYNKPLLGDLAVTFIDAKASSPIEYSYAIIAIIGAAIAAVAGYQFLKRIDMHFNDRHVRARCAAVKTFAAVSVLLFSIVAGTLLIGFGTANPVPPTSTISVTSPQKNKVYTVDNVSLTFSVTTHIYVSPSDPIGKPLIKYYLDGKLHGQFESDRALENFSVTLTGLSDGLHWVEVTKTAHWNVIMIGNYTETSSSGRIGFTVDTTHPRISILAPQDHQAYDATDIQLNFVVSEPARWISYSLDQQVSVHITGNTTLTGLSDGGHSLIVYARDNAGNLGVSEIFFSINTQQSQRARATSTVRVFPNNIGCHRHSRVSCNSLLWTGSLLPKSQGEEE